MGDLNEYKQKTIIDSNYTYNNKVWLLTNKILNKGNNMIEEVKDAIRQHRIILNNLKIKRIEILRVLKTLNIKIKCEEDWIYDLSNLPAKLNDL